MSAIRPIFGNETDVLLRACGLGHDRPLTGRTALFHWASRDDRRILAETAALHFRPCSMIGHPVVARNRTDPREVGLSIRLRPDETLEAICGEFADLTNLRRQSWLYLLVLCDDDVDMLRALRAQLIRAVPTPLTVPLYGFRIEAANGCVRTVTD